MRQHRIQGAVGVIGRTPQCDARIPLCQPVAANGGDQRRLANPCFTTEQDDLIQPRFTLLPTPQEYACCLLPSYQEHAAVRQALLCIAFGAKRSTYPKRLHRLGNTFQHLWSHIFQDKRFPKQPCRHATEPHRIGLRQAFQACRNIGRLPQGSMLLTATATGRTHRG